MLAGITLTITITIANLAFLKDNKDLQKNYTVWVDITNKILNNLQIGLGSFTNIMLTCVLAFVVLAIIIVARSFKENYKSKHLKVIAAAEEELKKEQV
ncbi:hypothetical protein [Paenibacillus hunanensis]|uniref:Membrane protein n=1 Tax=Paenibacillus hunanensis TaxID=539262 RepID=A0ABU1IW83_9BACL|nr:hypothetical protein [Paenibacillus hunanensis]MDR6243528.1 putative membrane protein [Paenibacillus hunanensis]GGI98389.1 hypothetical protein GCM10008022_03920 [Paenibacillus hunanensis]